MYAWNNVRNIDHVWRHIVSIWRYKYTSLMDIIDKITEFELNSDLNVKFYIGAKPKPNSFYHRCIDRIKISLRQKI